MKSRLKGAQTGHSLLKKKADALQMRFRLILGKIIEASLILQINFIHFFLKLNDSIIRVAIPNMIATNKFFLSSRLKR